LENKIMITIAMIALIAAVGTMAISMNKNAYAKSDGQGSNDNQQQLVYVGHHKHNTDDNSVGDGSNGVVGDNSGSGGGSGSGSSIFVTPPDQRTLHTFINEPAIRAGCALLINPLTCETAHGILNGITK
jgi:hypothetical protein